ncbi:hypothetical protein GCM10009789_66820 [Kribbella sancticallisti]|uniref:Secreted protein n=1 Tax=Kribbella sancticallisti TaxID=460087 RepID=A0ABP4Q9X0_9ACTN
MLRVPGAVLVVVVVQRDLGPGLAEPHRGRGPDATARPGDKNNLIREVEESHAPTLVSAYAPYGGLLERVRR